MLSSLFCFAILVLIDDPQGPPPATPRPVPRDPNSSEPNSLPDVAGTVPDSNNAAPKRTVQVNMDADLNFPAEKRCRAAPPTGAIS